MKRSRLSLERLAEVRAKDRQRRRFHYATNRDVLLAKQKEYGRRNRDVINAKLRQKFLDPAHRAQKQAIDKRSRLKRLDRLKDYQLQTRYGVTLAEFRALCEAQGGRCAVCRKVPTGKGKTGTLHVDHDHVTHVTRGLLCDTCNRGIGLLQDSLDVLSAAYRYLHRTTIEERKRA
jgi:hypothetical protein